MAARIRTAAVAPAAPAPQPARSPALPQAPPRRRGRPRKTAAEIDDGNRRRALLDAAARLFRNRGYAATGTRDIAAAVGMQSGSPFYHFKSKSALLNAVMVAGMRGALQRQHDALRVVAGTPARVQFAALVRTHFDILLGPGSDFIPVMLYEWRSLNARQRSGIAQLQREYDAPWLPVLDALAAAGVLRGDVRLARLFILGALNWSVQWFDPAKRASLDELTASALELFLQQRADGATPGPQSGPFR